MNEWKFVNFNLRDLSFIIEVWFEWGGSRPRARGGDCIQIVLDQIYWPINAPKCPKYSAEFIR